MDRTSRVDEETPLLKETVKKRPTPLPLVQFSIVMILQLVEPLTSQVIAPFTPQVCGVMVVLHMRILTTSSSSFVILG